MDLGTIRSRLETGRYATLGEVADDVRLTFRNALTYNEEGGSISKMASEAREAFEEDLSAIVEAACSKDKPGPPPPPPLRTNRTRRVPHPVLIGHAASLTPC